MKENKPYINKMIEDFNAKHPDIVNLGRAATKNTYIENAGIGYKCDIDELVLFLLNDQLGEVFYYPSPRLEMLEVNINGVILALANGRSVDIGTYPLYEKVNNITTPRYNLPNHLDGGGNIISKGQLDMPIGSINQWKPPSHSHTFPKNSFNLRLDYEYCKNDEGNSYLKQEQPYESKSFSTNILKISNTTTDNDGDYRPDRTALAPYIIVNYKG